MQKYGFKLDTDGLRIKWYFLKTTLASLHDEIKKDSNKFIPKNCERVVVTDSSKLRIAKQLFGLYVLLVLAQHNKIVSNQFIYNADFKCHATYTYLSEGFTAKHAPQLVVDNKENKINGKSL